MTIDSRLRNAADDLRAAVRPDALPPLRFPAGDHRSYRRPVLITALAVAAALVAVIAVSSRSSGQVHVTTHPTTPGCSASFVLPFAPRYLPTGWTPAGRHTAHAHPGTDFVEVWMGPTTYGVIEVWRGDNLPAPTAPLTTIPVLSGTGQLGPISDGSSVVFTIGDPANPCHRWALVAHPGITEEMLRQVATQLVPVS
jgi:hypothetical protein